MVKVYEHLKKRGIVRDGDDGLEVVEKFKKSFNPLQIQMRLIRNTMDHYHERPFLGIKYKN